MLSHQLLLTSKYIQTLHYLIMMEFLCEFYETFEWLIPDNIRKSWASEIYYLQKYQYAWINTDAGLIEMYHHTKAMQYMTAAISLLAMYHAAVEVMSANYYFLQITSGLAMLIFSVEIKVSDPRVTISTKNGFFQHRKLNKRMKVGWIRRAFSS